LVQLPARFESFFEAANSRPRSFRIFIVCCCIHAIHDPNGAKVDFPTAKG